MLHSIRDIITPLHKEGIVFILIGIAASLLFLALAPMLGWICVVVTLWMTYFFRDPVRVIPQGEDFVVSPADGKVQMITRAAPPPELEMGDQPLTRISIFLNVFDVHVNRVPHSGTIKKLHYHPGKFFNASLDKASEHNERQSVLLETTHGQEIAFVQIAGLVARRIVCDLQEGQSVKSGERYGIIRFGSRADVYLPEGVNPLVVVGQRAVGGETILANLKSAEDAREGTAI
ncbi:MAG: phosphatidylserine decarboxylase [Alphaproteobacteria bacterium]|nr:phosphatidylserine decarboxylase [Alphaproteobacteria bacterium]